MALEDRIIKLSLHEKGKDMVSGTLRPNDPNGNPYKLAHKPEDFPVIPSPAIFNFAKVQNSKNQKSNASNLSLPTLAECATHLEFLETLFILRQKVLVSKDLDEVFSISPDREHKTGYQGDTKVLKDDNFWEKRQVKWPRFVKFAAVRFLAWREQVNQSVQANITSDNLPPLDILMVWHSFLLNPRLFRTNCEDELLFHVKFPWQHIHDAINNSEWTFKLRPAAAANYEETHGLSPDLFDEILSWKGLSSLDRWRVSEIELGGGRGREIDNSRCKLYVDSFDRFYSELAVQLRDAVIRQGSFVDKMNSFMWIRSPALEGTIRRGIARYLNFCKLLKMSKNTVVPTLDIDLIWHTHQCTASNYGKAMTVLAGRFINHDDTIEKPQLGDGFGETRRLYRVYFGQEYRACGCWDCQALLTELDGVLERGEEDVDMDKITAKVKDDVFYHRAVEWSRRHKLDLPRRRD
ncbi:hypothetical protein FGRMN_2326 [Fusarium graminum]|nr:hypothetical protein FGRMN_2326 [Fusarium graminum]